MPLKEICGNHKESNATTMEINAPSDPQAAAHRNTPPQGKVLLQTQPIIPLEQKFRTDSQGTTSHLALWLEQKAPRLEHYSTLWHHTGLFIQHRSRGSTHSTSYSTLLLKASHSPYRPGRRLPNLPRRKKTLNFIEWLSKLKKNTSCFVFAWAPNSNISSLIRALSLKHFLPSTSVC